MWAEYVSCLARRCINFLILHKDGAFDELYTDLEDDIRAPRATTAVIPRRRTLTPANNLLLALSFLALYPKNKLLAFLFDVSSSYISCELCHIIPILATSLTIYVVWPSTGVRQQLVGVNTRFPGLIGHTDFTIHVRNCPLCQANFYWTDKAAHFIQSLLVIDPAGLICYFQVGFEGYTLP